MSGIEGAYAAFKDTTLSSIESFHTNRVFTWCRQNTHQMFMFICVWSSSARSVLRSNIS